jgi:hypothetical protein
MHSLLFIPYLNNYHLYLHEYFAIVHFEIAILQLVVSQLLTFPFSIAAPF